MSRSYRHTPIISITTKNSEKKYKKYEHKRLRRALRSHNKEYDIHDKEFGNHFWGPKDGKTNIRKYKNRTWYASAMRK